MMLFKKHLIELILTGRKTQTRRLWKRPLVKVGGTYAVKASYYQAFLLAVAKEGEGTIAYCSACGAGIELIKGKLKQQTSD